MPPGDHYKRPVPGDTLVIPARAYGGFCDVAEWFEGQRLRSLAGEVATPLTGTFPIRNDSGEDISRFGVLGIDSLIFDVQDNVDGFLDHPGLVGVKPQTPDHRSNFAIAVEPIRDGKIGRCRVSDVIQVKIDVGIEAHPFADVKHDSAAVLESRAAGAARILVKESGTGEKWALVRLGPISGGYVAKTTSSITARSGTTPGQGTVDLYEKNSDGEYVAFLEGETIYNSTSQTAASDAWIQVKADVRTADLLWDVADCA